MDVKDQQIEALQETRKYIVKLRKAIDNVQNELCSEKKEDTEEYMKAILQGTNWTLEILKRTLSFINEDKNILLKEDVNRLIEDFSKTYQQGDNAAIAQALETDLLKYLNMFDNAIASKGIEVTE